MQYFKTFESYLELNEAVRVKNLKPISKKISKYISNKAEDILDWSIPQKSKKLGLPLETEDYAIYSVNYVVDGDTKWPEDINATVIIDKNKKQFVGFKRWEGEELRREFEKNFKNDIISFHNKSESVVLEKESEHTKEFKSKYPDFDQKGKGRDSFTKEVARVTGVSKSILDDVYDRGVGAAKTTGTRASVSSEEQWAKARVYSFVTKSSGTWGRADKDLAEKVPDSVAKKL